MDYGTCIYHCVWVSCQMVELVLWHITSTVRPPAAAPVVTPNIHPPCVPTLAPSLPTTAHAVTVPTAEPKIPPAEPPKAAPCNMMPINKVKIQWFGENDFRCTTVWNWTVVVTWRSSSGNHSENAKYSNRIFGISATWRSPLCLESSQVKPERTWYQIYRYKDHSQSFVSILHVAYSTN